MSLLRSVAIVSILTLSLPLLLGTSCSSSNKVAVPPGMAQASTPGGTNAVVPTAPPLQVKEGDANLIARPVTSLGENMSPRFSADGSRLLFLSRTRATHRQAQVYELDLVRMTERRLTFHDGDDSDPAWTATGKFVYASGTDELKEDTVALGRLRETYGRASKAPKVDPALASEIYLQRLDGREIERLTSNDGYDGQPTPDPKTWRLAFVSDRGGKGRAIYMLDKRGTKRWSDAKAVEENPRISRDGQWLAFSRKSENGKSSQIFVAENLDAKKARALTSNGSRDVSPVWSPKGDWVLFLSDRGRGKRNLYAVARDGSCLKRVTEADFDIEDLDWSPDNGKVAFVSSMSGVRQIYVVDVALDGLACEGGAVAQASAPIPSPSH